MLDLTDLHNTPETLEQLEGVESDTVETFALQDRPAEQTLLLTFPLARAFAFLVGGGLTTLGVLGLLASLTGHASLLGIFQVDVTSSLLYLVTGLAGGAIWQRRREPLALAYTVALIVVYIVFFSLNNIAYGNAADAVATQPLVVLGAVRIHDLPAFMANGMQVTLALVALLTAGAVALQQGARATARRGRRTIREYRSHTRLRVTA